MQESEIINKYGIDIEALKKEQLKLAKSIEQKDSMDFSLATKFGAIENITVGNKIISAIIVCDKEYNIIEQQYFTDKLRFPYLHEFRSYREIPTMVEAFNKLTEKPDVVFIRGHGLTHIRLGIASHFSLLTGVPAIGVADSLFDEKTDKIQNEEIIREGKKIGKILYSKEKSNPLYVSVGSKISLNSAFDLVKKMINLPHKLPEPLHLAHKYARSVNEELKL